MMTRRIRVFPTREQEQVLWDLSEKCRLIYNFGLTERVNRWKENKEKPKEERKYITYVKQQNDLPSIKKQYPEYKWVYSKVLQMTLRKLDANFKSFFGLLKNGHTDARPPKFLPKSRFMTLCYNQSGFNIVENTISFSHGHPSGVPLEFDLKWLPEINRMIKQVEILRDHRHRFFVTITHEVEVPKYKDNGLYQAIDLGISNIVTAVNLHSKFVQIKNRRADLYWKDKISDVQSKRDHCKKHSNKWHWYHKKLGKMKRKMSNQLRDFQHKISKKIVENTKSNTIIIGDLNVKKMARKKKGTGNARRTKSNKTLNHSIQNTGSLGRFAEFLTYKGKLVGKRVTRIDESFTTQQCCKCGRKTNRKLFERFILCDCGNQIDRDENSAVNIMNRFLRMKRDGTFDFLSHQPSVSEESFLNHWNGFQRHTALPIIESGVDSLGTPTLEVE